METDWTYDFNFVANCYSGNSYIVHKRILNFYEERAEKISIMDVNKNKLIEVPFNNMLIFDFVKSMYNNKFLESKQIQKQFVLDDWFDENKTNLFLRLIKNILNENIEMTSKEFVFFVVICDKYQIEEHIFDFFFRQINNNDIDWKLYGFLIEESVGKIYGKYMERCLDKVKKVLSLDIVDIINIPTIVFVLAYPRNFLVELIKNHEKEIEEKDLVIQIVKKFILIKKDEKNKEFNLSIKAINDIFAAINWFFIPEETINQVLELKKFYPDFEVSSRIIKQINKRKKLIEGYKQIPQIKIFSFYEKLNIQIKEINSYVCLIDQKNFEIKKLLYTTSKEINLIFFLITMDVIKLKHITNDCIKIESSNYNFNLHITISLYIKKNEEFEIFSDKFKWNWTFGYKNNKPLKIKIPDSISEYKIVFHRVFLMDPSNDPFYKTKTLESNSDSG